MVDSTKNKNLIYKVNLADVGFANTTRTMIWCPVFDFRFENIERFRGIQSDSQGPYSTILLLGLLWIQYQRKLYVSFCLVDGHHF